MNKKKLLLIDDDAIFVRDRAACLSAAGFEVITAFDGAEGLAALQKEAAIGSMVRQAKEGGVQQGAVDLIILDLDMARMRGDEVLKRLKSDRKLWAVKVMVLTVLDTPDARENDRQTVKTARHEGRKRRGWDDNFKFVRKQDVRDTGELLKLVNSMLAGCPSVDIERNESEDWKILLVDDDRSVRSAIEAKLKDGRMPGESYGIYHAADGREALEILGSRPVDLVILDIDMPDTTGTQVLEVMKSNFVLKDIPVIINSKLRHAEAGAQADRTVSKGRFDAFWKIVEMDDASRVVELVADLLRTRREMGHGYLRQPVTFYRNKKGVWMKGPLEYYRSATCGDEPGRCSYCGKQLLPAETIYEYNPYKMFPRRDEDLKVQRSGDSICAECAREIVARYPDKLSAYDSKD